MNLPKRSVLLPVLVLIAVPLGCNKAGDGRQNSKDASLANWQSASEISGQLGEEQAVEGYAVRPPKGYTKSEAPGGPPGAKMIAWAGARRSDGTAPSVTMMVGIPPAGVTLPGLDEMLAQQLDSVKKRRQNWTQSVPEKGLIGGVTFARARWTGVDPASGRKMQGVCYSALDGRTVIQFQTQDIEPQHEQSLPLGEAAALSFKKT